MTKTQATFKVNLVLTGMTIDDLAKKIGVTKPTLYTRLRENNWKLGEIALIERL